jgi:hypothetical protein
MNVTALRRVGDHWPWVLDSVAVLRAAWSARNQRTDPLDLPGLWTFSAALLAMPLFLLRTDRATDGTVPAEVSGLFKVMQGVFGSTWRMWITHPERTTAPDVDEMTRTVVDRGLLHNTHVGRVCPAPEPMIRELFAAALNPQHIPRHSDETAALFAYGTAYAALSIEKWLVYASPSVATRAAAEHRDRLAGWSEGAPERRQERFTSLQRTMCEACGLRGPEAEFDLAWIPARITSAENQGSTASGQRPADPVLRRRDG